MKKWIQAAVVLCIISAAVACAKNSESDLPETSSGIAVYQMIPDDALHLDFLLDSAVIGENLGYGQSSGQYKKFRAQNYSLLVYAAGNRTDTLIATKLSLRNGHNLSVFLAIDSANTARLLVTDDDLTPPSTETPRAKFRFIDLSDTWVSVTGSNRLQPLSMDLYGNYVDTTSVPIYRSLGFGAVTPFTEVLVANYRMDLNWHDSSFVIASPGLNAQQNKLYTLVATGKAVGAGPAFKVWQYTNN